MQDKRYLDNLSNEEINMLSKNILFSLFKNHALNRNLARAIYTSSNLLSSNIPEQKLLKYPAIPLECTLEKLVKSSEPLLSKEELKTAKCEVEEFQKKDGKALQSLLEKVACSEENWLAERWLKAAYLGYRDPVVVFSSPGMTFVPQCFNSDDEMFDFTAKAIYANLKYKQKVEEHKMPIQKMGKLELDNSQFYKIFGTCRIPKPKVDGIEYNPCSKHVIVAVKNHFYNLPVYNEEGEIIRGDYIAKQLKRIWTDAQKAAKAVPIGLLTAENRDTWACAYEQLICPEGNLELVEKIQKSLFIVCLDEPVDFNEKNKYDVLGSQLIHGGGPCQNSGNRWFDKCIQLIVNRNGLCGFCYEHSPAEGVAIAQMADNIVDFAKNGCYDDCGIPSESTFGVCRLDFKLTPELTKFLNQANTNVGKLADDLHLKILHYKKYGKGLMKKFKLSPDSYIQMVMQYAYYRKHKKPGSHYESAHLRIFKNGRTETIRSCSNESIAFAKAFTEDCGSNEEKVELLKKAVNGHTSYTKEALQGKGVDRHLLGLKLMAIENNCPIPDFFNSKIIKRSTNFSISTSQVPSNNVAFMCYGPTDMNGYGICYNPREDDVLFAVSCWKTSSETDSDDMAVTIEKCLDHMKTVLEAQQAPKDQGCPKSKL